MLHDVTNQYVSFSQPLGGFIGVLIILFSFVKLSSNPFCIKINVYTLVSETTLAYIFLTLIFTKPTGFTLFASCQLSSLVFLLLSYHNQILLSINIL